MEEFFLEARSFFCFDKNIGEKLEYYELIRNIKLRFYKVASWKKDLEKLCRLFS